jgi:hypothetical protein
MISTSTIPSGCWPTLVDQPQQAKEVLDANMSVSTALPWRRRGRNPARHRLIAPFVVCFLMVVVVYFRPII